MPLASEAMSRRDSWPPTQVLLNPFRPAKDDEPRPLLDDMDDDPFHYFLTPAPALGLEDDMDFDAGIETPAARKDIVRSVSPSSLDGLAKPPPPAHHRAARPASPDFDSDVPTTDDEDDDEDYVRFGPLNFKLLTLSEFAIDPERRRRRRAHAQSSAAAGVRPSHLLSAASFPGPQPRGRAGASRGRPVHTRSLSASRSRPNHLWREPSPDVWSIEEETEEELMSECGADLTGREGNAVVDKDAPRSLRKKVRFVLPPRE